MGDDMRSRLIDKGQWTAHGNVTGFVDEIRCGEDVAMDIGYQPDYPFFGRGWVWKPGHGHVPVALKADDPVFKAILAVPELVKAAERAVAMLASVETRAYTPAHGLAISALTEALGKAGRTTDDALAAAQRWYESMLLMETPGLEPCSSGPFDELAVLRVLLLEIYNTYRTHEQRASYHKMLDLMVQAKRLLRIGEKDDE